MGACSLLALVNGICTSVGFYEPGGTHYGLQLLLENTLALWAGSQPVRRGIGSVHCSGSPIVISEFQLFTETQTRTIDNLLLDRSYSASPRVLVIMCSDHDDPGMATGQDDTRLPDLHTAPAAHIIIILAMGKEVLARDSINFLSQSV